jgi:hypothetical protein
VDLCSAQYRQGRFRQDRHTSDTSRGWRERASSDVATRLVPSNTGDNRITAQSELGGSSQSATASRILHSRRQMQINGASAVTALSWSAQFSALERPCRRRLLCTRAVASHSDVMRVYGEWMCSSISAPDEDELSASALGHCTLPRCATRRPPSLLDRAHSPDIIWGFRQRRAAPDVYSVEWRTSSDSVALSPQANYTD